MHPTFLGTFCKGDKIIHFGQFLSGHTDLMILFKEGNRPQFKLCTTLQ